MDHREKVALYRFGMTLLAVLAGLMLCVAVGTQYLKVKLLAFEGRAKYTVPVEVEVTGFNASPTSSLLTNSESEQGGFMAGLTYLTLESSAQPRQQGNLSINFEKFSFETEEQARTAAEDQHPLGQKLTVYCRPGDVTHASLESSPQTTNTASVLNKVSGILLGLALILLWGRSRLKRRVERAI